MTDEQTDAARDVLAERKRQVEAEGWTVEHDDAHVAGELALAASAYAANSATDDYNDDVWDEDIPTAWPWHRSWWKPTSRRRDLVKAGALILAEIERHDRASPVSSAPDTSQEVVRGAQAAFAKLEDRGPATDSIRGDKNSPMTDLDELERKARAATPGPWIACGARVKLFDASGHKVDCIMVGPDENGIALIPIEGDRRPVVKQTATAFSDAQFVAAANPAVILALIERVRVAERSERIARTNACILLKKLDDAEAWKGAPAELRQRVAKALWAAAPKRGLLAETKWEDIEPGWKLAFLSAADIALEALGLADGRSAC